MTLIYKALDDRDRFVSGEIEAVSQEAAVLTLTSNGLQVLAVQSEARTGTSRLLPSLGGFGIRERDVTGILRDLAMLLRAGIVLDEALFLLADGAARPQASLLDALRRRIREGATLSEALARHLPRPSPDLIAIVRIAEMSGKLGNVLETIANERASAEATAAKIASALRYPAFLLVLSVGILGFFLMFVVPQFAQVIRDFDTPTSGLIGVVLGGSDLLLQSGDIVVAIALALFVLGFLILRTERLRIPLLRSFARLPGIRGIVELRRTARFCNSIGMLVENGVTLTMALKVLTETASLDAPLLREVSERVRRGGRLAEGLAETRYVTPLAARMLRVGEESGDFAKVARRTGDYNQVKLVQKIDRLTAIVGPLAIVFISTIVGGLIVSIMTTLLSLNQVAL